MHIVLLQIPVTILVEWMLLERFVFLLQNLVLQLCMLYPKAHKSVPLARVSQIYVLGVANGVSVSVSFSKF